MIVVQVVKCQPLRSAIVLPAEPHRSKLQASLPKFQLPPPIASPIVKYCDHITSSTAHWLDATHDKIRRLTSRAIGFFHEQVYAPMLSRLRRTILTKTFSPLYNLKL